MGSALTVTLITLGLILALLGLIGCLLPVIPGPPISFLALIVLSYAKNWEAFSITFLVVMGVLTVMVVVLDYIVPAGGAKRYGASKMGVTGSIIGMLAGVFVFPPWGLFVGAFVGALIGELMARKGGKEALKAGWGVFVGIMVGTGLKLAFTGVILFLYVKELVYG
jgi:uncharacterized protein YqgC (DUF456 family)